MFAKFPAMICMDSSETEDLHDSSKTETISEVSPRNFILLEVCFSFFGVELSSNAVIGCSVVLKFVFFFCRHYRHLPSSRIIFVGNLARPPSKNYNDNKDTNFLVPVINHCNRLRSFPDRKLELCFQQMCRESH